MTSKSSTEGYQDAQEYMKYKKMLPEIFFFDLRKKRNGQRLLLP